MLFCALAGYLVAVPSAAAGHPHLVFDAKFEAVADPAGNLVEVRDLWHFDEVFSSSVLLDFDKNANPEA